MGQRANLILKHAGHRELYYAHWRANTLDSDLFWGPDAALAFIRRQRSIEEGAEWLSEGWAEGAAVVDLDERVLLWFGGEDTCYDVPLRRVHLGLMQELWPGWEIRWAHQHIWEVANYVDGSGEERLVEQVVSTVPAIREPADPDWISLVLSIRCADGRWKLHAFDHDVASAVLAGPGLAAALIAADLPEAYDYAARSDTFPIGGLHVDEAERRVEVWHADPVAAFQRRLESAWPGWDVRWHRDHFESVTEQLGPRLVLPHAEPEALVSSIRGNVLRAPRDQSSLVSELAHERAAGFSDAKNIQINPLALRDDVGPVPGPERTAAFERAVASWRRRGA